MSQPFDLSRFPDLPPEVVKAFGAVQFELSVERAANCQRRRKIRPRGGVKPGQVAVAGAMARALTNSWRVPWRIGLFGPKRAI